MIAPRILAAVFAALVAALAVGAVHAQQTPATPEQETMIVTDFDRLFEPKTATITITTAGISVTPDPPGSGPVTFTVNNQTGTSRGVVMTGIDRADTPIIRYTRMIGPGGSATTHFWIYPERQFQVRDYTARRIVAGESIWTSTFTTAFAGPAAPTMVVAVTPEEPVPTIPPPIGAGPEEPRNVQVSIVNRTLVLDPSTVQPGIVNFTIRNTTTSPRMFGIEMDGELYQTRLLNPGEEETLQVNVTTGTYDFFTVIGGQRTLTEPLTVR